MEEYKSNSFKSKEEQQPSQPEEKKVQQVITSGVKTRKKSGWDKFTEQFISEDSGKVTDYVVHDIVVPSIKKTISEVVKNAIDIILFGKSTESSSSASSLKPSYRQYYDSAKNTRDYPRRILSTYNYDEIILPNRGEAEVVLEEMDNIIRRYGFARVSDLYDLVGIQGTYTDNNYGWSDLRSAYVVRDRDGYLLKMPRPMPID